jgi:mycothiol synthase
VTLPAGYVTRPAGADDLDAVTTLFVACDLADVGFEDPVREHITETWRASHFELARDTILIGTADGRLAGYADAAAIDPVVSVDAFGRVHPEHRARGLGAHLVSWTEARTVEHASAAGSPTKLWNAIPSVDEPAHRLLTARGYAPVRTFRHMERLLDIGDGRSLAASPPDPIGFRVFEPGRDERTVYDVWRDAFAEHFGFTSEPFEEWRKDAFGGPGFEPKLVLIAEESDEVVGVQMATRFGDVGWVDIVGVRKPWRGRGIARALLVRGFEDLAARGCRSARLNVDAGNETGATRLYESVGMSVRREWHLLERRIEPA